ncbi:MAG: DUF465 domain-containing protein [Nitrosomonadales bacterium]|nr:MAG: DUF465 domain-containing protein [Nitrosomonadales bacterium]
MQIIDMQIEHHDLDAVITKLSENSYPDQLQLNDMITKLKEKLMSDILA